MLHYALAVLLALASLLLLIGVGGGYQTLQRIAESPPPATPPSMDPIEFGIGYGALSAALVLIVWAFMAFSVALASFTWLLSMLTFVAARNLKARRGRLYCVVVAVLNVFLIPLGTALSVFTLVVLARPSVKATFVRQRRPDPPRAVAELPASNGSRDE